MLQSLERQSGLPIAFDPRTKTIHCDGGVKAEHIAVRTARDMRSYTAEPEARSTSATVYTVYRNIARPDDRASIESEKLRYDITVIPSGHFVGRQKEFFRTAGHYHAFRPDGLTTYPEVYEVISGRAYWLLQRPRRDDPSTLEEIYAVEAGPGEKAVILPGFGHISINAYPEPLVIANWISTAFSYDYGPFERLRGGGYWLVEENATTIAFEKNSFYRRVPPLQKLRPREVQEFHLRRSQPLYTVVRNLALLRFLSIPEAFNEFLRLDKCYQAV